ncbi:MAG: hypothetical protein WD887_03050 [Candidatus Saccharimonadales bacterium]
MTTAKIPPKPGKDTIYIDVDDEITSIISKVEAAKEKVAALVLPKRASALKSIVNMRLLKRSADVAGKNVVLITGEQSLLPLAGAAGLHVAKTLQSKPEVPAGPDALENLPAESLLSDNEANLDELPQKIDYQKSIGELATSHDVENPEAIPLEDEDAAQPAPPKLPKVSKDKKLKVPNFDRFRLLIGAGVLGVLALIIFLILAIYVLPKATITIMTTSTPVSGNFTLTASGTAKTLDVEKKIIPSELMTSDQTAKKEVQATGQKNLGKKASGSVTMTAQKCAPNLGQPSNVPAGTGLSNNGLTYITQTTTSFSATGVGSGSCVTYSATASTGIVAQIAGSKYNVNSANFSVSGRSDVSASGDTSGGTDNNVTVLSQEDVDKVRQEITSEESDEFMKALQKDLDDDGHYVLTSTLKLNDPVITAVPAVGQQTSNANVTVKVTYTVLTLKKDDFKKFLEDNLNSQIKDSSQRLSGDVLKDANVTVQNQKKADATLSVGIETVAMPVIDIQAIKNQVKGQKRGNIQSTLSALPGVKDVKVKLSPFWVSKVPGKTSKITVVVEPEKTAEKSTDDGG